MRMTLAQAALRYAKACIPLGCNNQGVGQLSKPKAWSPTRDPLIRYEASSAVVHLKTLSPQQGCTMQEVVAYGRKVMQYKAGNCMEQCAAACLYLSGSHEKPVFRLVQLQPPGDHIFLVLDQLPEKNGFFPDNFADWNNQAIIIDPWVSICCKANDYLMWWSMRLDVMATAGEELATSKGWKKANSLEWKNAPSTYRKLNYTV
ncbi:MAG: hypothetical protein V4623_05670 [Pseudomonadota bacterium]